MFTNAIQEQYGSRKEWGSTRERSTFGDWRTYLAGGGFGPKTRLISVDQIGLRVGKALSRLICRVGYNHGRPIALMEDNILQLARGLLKHPLSKLSDSRFVVSVELIACRRKSTMRLA